MEPMTAATTTTTTTTTTGSTTNATCSERITETVIDAVAAESGVDPLELEPLYHVVDPDALNDLFRSTAGDSSSVELRFTMAGCQVVVRGDGDAVVTQVTDAGAPAVESRGD